MVSFKFRTSKTVNFATDVPSKHGFHLNDLNRICVYLHYYDKENDIFIMDINGFIRKIIILIKIMNIFPVKLIIKYI